jgi:hypothetical protein
MSQELHLNRVQIIEQLSTFCHARLRFSCIVQVRQILPEPNKQSRRSFRANRIKDLRTVLDETDPGHAESLNNPERDGRGELLDLTRGLMRSLNYLTDRVPDNLMRSRKRHIFV